jgi:alkylhydroperoxidase/carboxymuconolactone decarboxylase family protein YurZ
VYRLSHQGSAKLGATRQELDEMLAVAVYMGGGPALMYAAEAIHAWEEMAAPTSM